MRKSLTFAGVLGCAVIVTACNGEGVHENSTGISRAAEYFTVPGQMASGINASGQLLVMYGNADDGQINDVWQSQAGGGWDTSDSRDYARLGGFNRVAVAQNLDGRLELFFISADGHVYHEWQTAQNGPFSTPWNIGVQCTLQWPGATELAVGRNQDGRLEVFYIGDDSNLYHAWQTAPNAIPAGTNDGWTDQVALGGSATNLAVGQNQNGCLEVAYIRATDNAVCHNYQISSNGVDCQNVSGWHGEEALGGLGKQLVYGQNQDGHLELIYIGTNDGLYHNWQVGPNSPWHGEDGLGGSARQIALGHNQNQALELFYIGTDPNYTIYHNWQTSPNGTWSSEYLFAGQAKQIVATQNRDGRQDIIYRGTDDGLYHSQQLSPNGSWILDTPLIRCGHYWENPCNGQCYEGFVTNTNQCRPSETRTGAPSTLNANGVLADGSLGVDNSGNWSFRGHLYNGNFFGVNYTLGVAINIPSYTFGQTHSGTLGGELDTTSRSDSFTVSGVDYRIADNWDAIKSAFDNRQVPFNLHQSTNGWLVGEAALIGLNIVGPGAVVVILGAGGGVGQGGIQYGSNPNCHWDDSSGSQQWVCP